MPGVAFGNVDDFFRRPFGHDFSARRAAFRADTGMHAEQFKIVNVENNEELASVGS